MTAAGSFALLLPPLDVPHPATTTAASRKRTTNRTFRIALHRRACVQPQRRVRTHVPRRPTATHTARTEAASRPQDGVQNADSQRIVQRRPNRRPTTSHRETPARRPVSGGSHRSRGHPWDEMCKKGCSVGESGVQVPIPDRGGGAPPTPPPRSGSI